MKKAVKISALMLFCAIIFLTFTAGCIDSSNTSTKIPIQTQTTAPVISGDISGLIGTWSSEVQFGGHDNKTDLIYAFNDDGTGKAYYYEISNGSVTAAVPYTWSTDKTESGKYSINISYTKSKTGESEIFTYNAGSSALSDAYDIKYTKLNADAKNIAGSWKSVTPYFQKSDNKSYEINYILYENKTGLDKWFDDNNNMTSSDPMTWDLLRIIDDGSIYVYYLDYPGYAVDVGEVFMMTADGSQLADKYDLFYYRV